MSLEEEQKSRETAIKSLERVQEFDVSTLPRENELGMNFRFTGAVEPAKRIVELFRRLPISALDDFAKPQLDQIEKQAASCYNLFNQVLEFDETQANAITAKDNLINQINNAYQGAFNVIHPFVGYALYKTADFQRLETEARAALQSIKDEADSITKELSEQKENAETALEEIRKIAAEKGVTQEAIHFQKEADDNETKAEEWRVRTIRSAWLLGGFAVASLFFHKLPFLNISSNYDMVQLVVSKVLIFAVISYILFLSAKNFLSHRHNAIVNRHRQNALMTYKTLVEAAGDNQQSSNAVLVHAAACIYSPQATGYTQNNPDSQNAKSVIELLSKPLSINTE